jgi:predicted ATPase
VPIRSLSIEGYRSIRRLDLPIDGARVVVVAGPNASGKTNLYRALQLLAAAAGGRLARTLAEEGGMPSALWAGKRRKEAVRMRVAVDLDDFSYELACGLPAASGHGSFILDPVVKSERASVSDGGRSSDGTLRYLCLLAALLSPRPPSLLALNEPETSLHPDLLDPLAHLVADAGQRGQIWLTTHAEPLAAAIGRLAGIEPLHLTKVQGETRIVGRRPDDDDDGQNDHDDQDGEGGDQER